MFVKRSLLRHTPYELVIYRGCGVAKVLACQAAMQQSGVRFPPYPQRSGSCQGANDQALCDKCDSNEGHKHCSESGKGEQ